MMIEIMPATSDELIAGARTLSKEYVVWMVGLIHQHYPEIDTSSFISAHDYEGETAKFPGEYVAPYGRLLVARYDGEVGGCIALGKLSPEICEMRTLFVRPQYRGLGMGKKLVEATLTEARTIGYSIMRLETLAFMESALGLYRSLGFKDIAPYRQVEGPMQTHIRFLEYAL